VQGLTKERKKEISIDYDIFYYRAMQGLTKERKKERKKYQLIMIFFTTVLCKV
jgi:hypothetical protein